MPARPEFGMKRSASLRPDSHRDSGVVLLPVTLCPRARPIRTFTHRQVGSSSHAEVLGLHGGPKRGTDPGHRSQVPRRQDDAGTPDEVATVAALLMGADGAFITGSDFL